MKYEVEITTRYVYEIEADSYEEARELAINGSGDLIIDDEVIGIEVRRVV